MTPKERMHAAMKGLPHDRTAVTPIFMAWAAHHVGKTYRDYYLDHRVLAQSQIATARDLNTDQVSAISDPWREAEAYGMTFDYPDEGVGQPRSHLLQSPDDIVRLTRLNPLEYARMRDRVEGVAMMARAVGQTHSVLGWVEGPLAEYADLRGVQETMLDLMDSPETFERAAAVMVDNAIDFAAAQVQAGADVIGVGDAVVSLINVDLYMKHVWPWQRKLFAGIHAAGGLVKLHICGNISRLVPHLADTGVDVLDLDWMVDIPQARKDCGDRVCLCGNFDPAAVLLRGTPAQVSAAAQRCVQEGGPRFILQPGCEVPPGTPLENLRAFCPAD